MDVRTMAKRGNKRMRKKRTAAEFLAWSLMGGPKRKKDVEVTVMEYFSMGWSLAGELSRRMEHAKLPVEDGEVFIVATDPDFTKPRGEYYKLTPGTTHGLGDLEAAMRFAERYIIIGLVVSIWDRNTKQRLVHARPFIVSNPAVARLLGQAVEDIRKQQKPSK
jgi:hypothetical protein